MTWTQSILDDEKHFPQKIGTFVSSHIPLACILTLRCVGVRFPPTFVNTAKTILRRLFRVYAHIYHSHFDQICALGIEGEAIQVARREMTADTLVQHISTPTIGISCSSSMR